MIDLITFLLGLAAYIFLGIAYMNIQGRAAGKDWTPMGALRTLNSKIEEGDPELSMFRFLPTWLIVATTSFVYCVCLSIWPVLAVRRAALALKGRKT